MIDAGLKFPAIKLEGGTSLPDVPNELVEAFLRKFPKVGKPAVQKGVEGCEIDVHGIMATCGLMAFNVDREMEDDVRMALYLACRSMHAMMKDLDQLKTKARA